LHHWRSATGAQRSGQAAFAGYPRGSGRQIAAKSRCSGFSIALTLPAWALTRVPLPAPESAIEAWTIREMMTISVTMQLRAITGTRVFEAGLRLCCGRRGRGAAGIGAAARWDPALGGRGA